MGIRCPFPFAASCNKPIARGPFLFFGLICARLTCTSRKMRATEMTARQAVRYNFGAGGETSMDVNDKAPEFTLPDQNGKDVALKDFRGKNVVLYFYPRADTPGCTIEACEFRDSYKKLQKTGAILLGISPDTPKAQKKFEEKFD